MPKNRIEPSPSSLFSSSPPPSQRKKPYVPIERPRDSNRYLVRGWCLSPEPAGVDVHWVGRNRLCTDRLGSCSHCDAGVGSKWFGYLGMTKPNFTGFFLVELTPSLHATVEAWIKQKMTLRACYLTISRPSQTKGGRLQIEITAPIPPVGTAFPGVPDLEETILRIYGHEPIEKKEANHERNGHAAHQ